MPLKELLDNLTDRRPPESNAPEYEWVLNKFMNSDSSNFDLQEIVVALRALDFNNRTFVETEKTAPSQETPAEVLQPFPQPTDKPDQ